MADRGAQVHRRIHNSFQLQCPTCNKMCANRSGLTQHENSMHAEFPFVENNAPPGQQHALENEAHLQVPNEPIEDHNNAIDYDPIIPGDVERGPGQEAVHNQQRGTKIEHDLLNGTHSLTSHLVETNPASARPCTEDGTAYLPPETRPNPRVRPHQGDWAPFNNRLEFEVGEFLFKRNQMSLGNIGVLMNLWAASLLPYGAKPPFANSADMLAVIDAIDLGDAPWQSFTVCYTGPLPAGRIPTWMTQEYSIWTRNPQTLVQLMFDNADFDGEIDYIPYCELNEGGMQRLTDFFSGNWVWRQAVRVLPF